MRLAVLKMGAVAGDVAANLALIDAAAGQAAAGGARLLVAPELALTGYGAGEAIRDLAEPADGPQVARLRSLAKAHGLGIVAGFAEREGEHIFNSLVLADGEAPPSIYRKTNLYGAYERRLFTPGNPQSDLRDFDGVRPGLLIC